MRTFDQGRDPTVRAVVLVEGVSDQLALEALAVRRGRHLDEEGVSIVPMGGATNIARLSPIRTKTTFVGRAASEAKGRVAGRSPCSMR